MRSAGGLDGNYADFSLDGVQVELVSGRGFSVVIMDQDGGVQSKHVYDTGYQADDSGPLVTLLNELPEGTPVLVATMDDASESLTSEAKASIETLGATKISSISYRDSYALIAIKGQSAIAEAHSPAGEGAIELKSKALWMPSCVDGSTTAQGLTSSTQAGTTLSTGRQLQLFAPLTCDTALCKTWRGNHPLIRLVSKLKACVEFAFVAHAWARLDCRQARRIFHISSNWARIGWISTAMCSIWIILE